MKTGFSYRQFEDRSPDGPDSETCAAISAQGLEESSRDNSLGNRVEIGCILPAQFSRVRRTTSAEGEKKLMLAVLADAICCYIGNMNAPSQAARLKSLEVQEWFNARDRQALFAFENICDMLDLDPDWLRRELKLCTSAARRSSAADALLATNEFSPREPRR